MDKELEDKKERIMFITHAVKRFCYGFEVMKKVAKHAEAGSPELAFYFDSIYQYISIFFLLLKEDKQPLGGTFYKALKPIGLSDKLAGIEKILSKKVGKLTFGEIIRMFRNNVIAHTTYSDSDLDPLYNEVDFSDLKIQEKIEELLEELYLEIKHLPIVLCEELDIPLESIGMH